ncbi:hypothetical protein FRB97_001351 [Tulasnella sp. 331]|nr:hypothetical protein FRB97_001351 [Tulasnella sp. 331]KAG8885832.1 hypothetical protein FRB98_001613 [Tulasnella sp. 332]
MLDVTFVTLSNVAVALSTLFVFAAVKIFASIQHPSFPPNSPPRLTGLPFLGPLEALSAPWRLFQRGMAISPSGNFAFNLGYYRAIGLTSPAGREAFFNSPKLGLPEGYGALMIPTDSRTQEERDQEEHEVARRLKTLMTKEWLGQGLQNMISDVNARFDDLGSFGKTNPFHSIHEIVFQLTVRTVGCREIAEDAALRAKALRLVEVFDATNTASTMLFPLLPMPAQIRRFISGISFYKMIDNIVAERTRSGRTENDPLQYLMEQGDAVVAITKFIYGSLFAGVINTGVNTAWVLCQLGTHPEWITQVREEIARLGAKYAADPDASLPQQLLSVPLEAWESELPILELCLKETLRLHLQSPLLRRNISDNDFKVEDEVIPKGAVVFFFTPTVDMNAVNYRDPEVWDPNRFLPDRAEDKLGPHTFLGWGSGRHPCRGMRFAKLEMNVILAFFLARFQYEVLDGSGKKLQGPLKARPRNFQLTKENFYLKYHRI